MNIYRRFLLYLLSAGLLSFLALSAVFLWSLYDANQKAVQNGRDMGTAVETTIAGMDAYFAKQQLLLFAQGKAQFMDSELRTFGTDTQHIAMEMERLLSAAGQYRPRELKRAGTQPVMPGEACIYYSHVPPPAYAANDVAGYGLRAQHHGVTEVAAKQGRIDETWAYVREADVEAALVRKLL